MLLNQPGVRRKLIMDVLNDDPGEYMELLKKARMNDDVEVVHYAITAMVELSKDYDYRLQQIERRYARQPEDPAAALVCMGLFSGIVDVQQVVGLRLRRSRRCRS